MSADSTHLEKCGLPSGTATVCTCAEEAIIARNIAMAQPEDRLPSGRVFYKIGDMEIEKAGRYLLFTAVSELSDFTESEHLLEWAAFNEVSADFCSLRDRVQARVYAIAKQWALEHKTSLGDADEVVSFYVGEKTVTVNTRDYHHNSETVEFPIELMQLLDDDLAKRKAIIEASVAAAKIAAQLAHEAHVKKQAKELEERERIQYLQLKAKYGEK